MSDTILVPGSPASGVAVLEHEEENPDVPYEVQLFDDPVSSIVTVLVALGSVFGYSKEKSLELAHQAEEHGRVSVWSGEKQKAEHYCVQLHTYLLTATVVKA